MRSIKEILKQDKVIAVVGLSPRAEKPSHWVASYLKRQGYRVIPVNPKVQEVLGEKSYPDLTSVPESVDIVNVFRRAEETPPIVEEAIRAGAKVVWMQEGIVNLQAAARAQAAGLDVVMDRCIMVEHQRLREAS